MTNMFDDLDGPDARPAPPPEVDLDLLKRERDLRDAKRDVRDLDRLLDAAQRRLRALEEAEDARVRLATMFD